MAAALESRVSQGAVQQVKDSEVAGSGLESKCLPQLAPLKAMLTGDDDRHTKMLPDHLRRICEPMERTHGQRTADKEL
jgi:hypothetical protein